MRTIEELNELDFTYKVSISKHKTSIDNEVDYDSFDADNSTFYYVDISGSVVATSGSIKLTANWSALGEARSDSEPYDFDPIEFRNICISGTTIVDEANKPIDQVRLQGLLSVAFEGPDNELVDAVKDAIKNYTHDAIESIYDTRCD